QVRCGRRDDCRSRRWQTPLAVPGVAIGVAGRMAKDDRWLPFGDSNICSAGTSLRRRISRSAKQTGPSAHNAGVKTLQWRIGHDIAPEALKIQDRNFFCTFSTTQGELV
ncbi:hypothetical protein, partial [Mesorhizobium sp. M7A.F.Ca.CA.004.04.1.1]|uniref:hypothetical protein n=1 Tax=Mesorhizobium sp. M7A.F.Ca.CA.004.04.1.1 TaxID=2496733 RepID=UPI0019D28491